MASELHHWRFELEICPSRLPCGHVFEPKVNARQGAICEAFFSKCFEQSTSWCFGSHFFVARPTSLWLGPIDSLPFATVVFWLLFFFLKKKHGKKTPLSTFHCNQLQHTRWHALKLICQTAFNSILFKSLLSHAGQLSCRDVTEVM